MDFGRLITAMVTPFDENLHIDWTAAGKLIDYLIDEMKSDSLVISGTTGESPTLSDEEKGALFRFCVKQAKGRCKIIAGTGSNSTAHAVLLTQLAEQAGVDGVLVVVPYYNKPSQEGLYFHFRTVAQSTSLPVILYNVPSRTVTSLAKETILRLAEISNIKGIKECVFNQVADLIAHGPQEFRVYTGEDELTLPALSFGAYGVISVASHLVGEKMKKMIECYLAGNVNEAQQRNEKLLPFYKGLFNCPHPLPNPVAVKFCLSFCGLSVGGVRLPLVQANRHEKDFLKKLMSPCQIE